MARSTVAARVADLIQAVLGVGLPLRIRAWDGSEWGRADHPLVDLRSPRALRRMVWLPNERGLAEAYLSADLTVGSGDGADLTAALAAVRSIPSAGSRSHRRWQLLRGLPAAARLGVLGPRPPRPGSEVRLAGAKHSRQRDRAAIAHHYDLSNEFYEILLDDSMAYSCGYFLEGADLSEAGLAEAQRAKLDLVCRKLGLSAGMTHLDIGCGWGSLICHAAKHFGTRSTGVTLSRQQFDHVSKRVADEGLSDLVDVRLADYRELADGTVDGRFDAVSTIEMGEHVGDAEYPAFTDILFRVLRPGGRALVQQMSRGRHSPGGGAFIETYIAPDMHMRPMGETVELLAGAGFEVRDVHALREHYTWTCRAWLARFEARAERAHELLGGVGVRVWRLYLAGSALAFAENRMGVDQILAVRPDPDVISSVEPSRKVWQQ